MKRIAAVLLSVIMLLCLSGCGRSVEFTARSVIDPSDTIILAFKDGTNKLTNEGHTIIITNNTEYIYCYGTEYWLEGKKDGEWYELKRVKGEKDFAWTAILLEVGAGESKEMQVSWDVLYGKLPKGEYRIVKPGYLATEDPGGQPTRVSDEYAVVEFEITK